MPTIVSAPGKVILLGEHTVVYQRLAVVAAIDKRLYVQIKRADLNFTNCRKDKIFTQAGIDKYLVKQAIKIFSQHFWRQKLPSFEISVFSQIPVGCGLGSSAALAAAVNGALLKYINASWKLELINKLTKEVEKIAHGNPSGADNTAVVFGGLLSFRKETGGRESVCVWPVKSSRIAKFLLINSGRPKETTKEMVSYVAKLYRKNRREMEKIFSDQEIQTKKILLYFKKGGINNLISALYLGERNLEKMGVVGETAKKIITEIEKIQGVAKVCGAGGRQKGSGIILCYHQDLNKIRKIADQFKLPTDSVVLGGEGVRVEHQPISVCHNLA